MKQNRDNIPFKWDPDAQKNAAIWKTIDDAVNAEANSIRVLKKVFMASSAPPDGPIFVEKIDSDTLEITGIGTREYVDLSMSFDLDQTLAGQEAARGFCRLKAIEAATKIAKAEDILFFQGAKGKLPDGITIKSKDQLTMGLLEAAEKQVVPVAPLPGGKTYGENTFGAVAKGLALLDNSKPENYALFLDPTVYADTYALYASTTTSLISLADRIKGLVAGGFDKTGALPPRTGLLARLNGDPASFYYADSQLFTEYVKQEDSNHFFRVYERIQYVVRKPKAFAKLEFEELPKAHK